MNKAILFLVLICQFVLIGCTTSNPVHQYNDKESKALNIYKAAGLTGIADVKMPEEMRKSSGSNGTYALANGIVNYNSASFLNLSPWSAFGLGFLSALSTSNMDPNSDGIIAWMPTTLAKNKDEAVEVMMQLFIDATKKIADDKKLTFKTKPERFGYTSYFLFKKDNKCKNSPNDPECWYFWGAKLSSVSVQPSFLNNETKDAYFFAKSDSRYYISESTLMDKFTFLKTLSANLPDWIVFYYAPKKVSKGKTPPLIINKGEILYFITPESQSSSEHSK